MICPSFNLTDNQNISKRIQPRDYRQPNKHGPAECKRLAMLSHKALGLRNPLLGERSISIAASYVNHLVWGRVIVMLDLKGRVSRVLGLVAYLTRCGFLTGLYQSE